MSKTSSSGVSGSVSSSKNNIMYMSRVFNYDDPTLIEALCATLNNMVSIKIEPPTSLTEIQKVNQEDLVASMRKHSHGFYFQSWIL